MHFILEFGSYVVLGYRLELVPDIEGIRLVGRIFQSAVPLHGGTVPANIVSIDDSLSVWTLDLGQSVQLIVLVVGRSRSICDGCDIAIRVIPILVFGYNRASLSVRYLGLPAYSVVTLACLQNAAITKLRIRDAADLAIRFILVECIDCIRAGSRIRPICLHS
ncbi:hypothetical protein D3C72_783620 [compost metagenome]